MCVALIHSKGADGKPDVLARHYELLPPEFTRIPGDSYRRRLRSLLFMLVLCIRGLFNSLVSCNKLWKTRRFGATNSERFDDFVQQTLKDSMISCNKLWKTRWFRATNSERLDDFEQQTLKQSKTKFCGEISMTFSRTCVCRVKLQAPVYTFCNHCCVCVCRLRQA